MNKRDEKIIAVLLTHNRKDLLQEGLKGLLSQTYPLEKVIVVDSVSTDGTYETLREKGIIDRSDIRYIRLKENKGPSGGFAEGITYALEENPTWVWILDDDISPKEDCLEALLEFRDISQCIAPYREGKTVPFFNPAIGVTSHSKSLSFDTGKSFVFTNTCCFEGMLLHADLIKKIGVPDERFFQVYGDTMYGFVSSIYTNVVHVKKAVIHRLLPGKKPVTSRRVYLLVRNHFLVKEYLKKYDLLRPSLFVSIFVLMILYYSTVMAFRTRSISMPFAVIKGIVHGLSGKFGAPK
jgi:GT2 family glycosyltransferase